MSIQIRRARADEAGILTEIAHAAKRHWGYPENWIQHWKADLTITPQFIQQHQVFAAILDEQIVGCCAIVRGESIAELEHMWIRPDHMGQGVGRALFNHAREKAADLQVPELELSADPHAEGFYRHLGATRIGEVQADMEGQSRVLPRMKVTTTPEHKKQPPGW